MSKPFDPTKPVQTRDGRKARIICTDRKGCYPIVALVDNGAADDHCYFLTSGGQMNSSLISKHDLVNIPVKKEGWINVYPARNGYPPEIGTSVWPSADTAKDMANRGAVQARIEWEE